MVHYNYICTSRIEFFYMQTEFPLPEQFKTVWNGKKLVTEATESTG